MTKLLKFAVVGGSGALLNLALFYLLVDRAQVNPTGGAAVCFTVAVTSNYLLDHLWTFRTQIAGERPSVGRYLLFVAVSLAGLGVNLGVLNLVLVLVHPELKVIAQAAGISCGMLLNYAGSNLFAFRSAGRRGPDCFPQRGATCEREKEAV